VLARLERGKRERCVGTRRRGDRDGVDVTARQQPTYIGLDVDGGSVTNDPAGPGFVQVAHRDEIPVGVRAEVPHQIRAPVSGTDDGDRFHELSCSCSVGGSSVRGNSPKAVAALQYAISLINAQGGWDRFKSFRDTWDFFGKKNQVAEDQVGAWPMEQWYYNVLAGSSPQVHITALQFRNLKGQPINYETGSAWAIPKGAKNTAAACTWMKTMTSTSTWMAAAKNRAALRKKSNQPYTGLSTGNSVADQQIYDQTYTSINKFFDQAVKKVLDVQRFSFGIPASPASAEFAQAWNDAVNRVLAGQQSPKAALDQAQKEAVAAIKKAS
jgi:multiple sugar transport system substrate-binding protein